MAADRTGLVAQVTVALLEVRAQRAAELRAEQLRLHSTLIRLLLDGHTTSVTATVGGDQHGLTHATVYRITGPDIPTAHQVLWRAVSPTLTPGRSVYVLLGQLEGELVAAELHGGTPDDGRLLRLVSRVTDRHNLLAGLAGPLPLDEVGAAYADAAVARHSASPARRIVPATAVGASGLAQLLPADPYTSWSAAVLKPLTLNHRHLLTVWLRTGSIPCTATALGISPGTVRTRLRETGRLLRTDLADAGIRAHLLLALRAPPRPGHSPTGGESLAAGPAVRDPRHPGGPHLGGRTPRRAGRAPADRARLLAAPPRQNRGLHSLAEQCAAEIETLESEKRKAIRTI